MTEPFSSEQYPKKKPTRGPGIVILLLIVVGIATGWLAFEKRQEFLFAKNDVKSVAATIYREASSPGTLYAQGQPDIGASRKNAIVTAVKNASPAVVSISVTQLVRPGRADPFFNDPFFDLFYPNYRKKTYKRDIPFIGSGFLISPDGYILTNSHVIENAHSVAVTLPNKERYEAKIIGNAPEHDLALLKIEGKKLPFITLGKNNYLLIGEWAIALGNPFGMVLDDPNPSVTVGVISALNRDFADETRMYKNMIQTDAAINPGNSGGPLLNARGECIGINTFILTKSGGSMGLGFAIPVDRAKEVVDEIVAYGRVREAWTGLTVQNVDRLIAHSLGLGSVEGVIVANVALGSPSAEGGVHVGDVIVAVNGRTIAATTEIRKEFLGARVGDRFELAIVRGNRQVRLTITLKELPHQ